MLKNLAETILGIDDPWYVRGIGIDVECQRLEVSVDFTAGTHFPYPDTDGLHPVHDTVERQFRAMDWSIFKCVIKARMPRVRLPDGRVVLAKPKWVGKLTGFTLMFEAMIITLAAAAIPWSRIAELTKTSDRSVRSILKRYVELGEANVDLSGMTAVAVDETSAKRGHNYVTIVADAEERKVVFVAEGRSSEAIQEFAEHLTHRNATPDQITDISMDMSPAYISGAQRYLPNACITFDKYHVVAQASEALDQTRRQEQKNNADLKGKRWILLKDWSKLNKEDRAALDDLLANVTTRRTAQAWLYREQLRDILDRQQINVVSRMLKSWCSRVLRSKVEEMHKVARMIRKHFDGIIAWSRTRQTNGFLEAINGLFQSAKRAARGYRTFETMRAVIFFIAGDLDFHVINPYVRRN